MYECLMEFALKQAVEFFNDKIERVNHGPDYPNVIDEKVKLLTAQRDAIQKLHDLHYA